MPWWWRPQLRLSPHSLVHLCGCGRSTLHSESRPRRRQPNWTWFSGNPRMTAHPEIMYARYARPLIVLRPWIGSCLSCHSPEGTSHGVLILYESNFHSLSFSDTLVLFLYLFTIAGLWVCLYQGSKGMGRLAWQLQVSAMRSSEIPIQKGAKGECLRKGGSQEVLVWQLKNR